MSEHAKEPWKAKGEDGCYSDTKWTAEHPSAQTYESAPIVDNSGNTVALVVSTSWTSNRLDANAMRIVACVNACAEIPTEDLEESSMSILEYMEDQYGEKLEALKQQHDELLASLKEASAADDYFYMREVINAAIAKAEAKS